MKTGISAAIRRFIEKHIVADDPYPERSWLDAQDMPRLTVPVPETASGLPVTALLPLPGRHFGHRRVHPFNRLRGRHQAPAHHGDDAPGDQPMDPRFRGRWPS
jgi:hypothetical protein